MKDSGYAYAIIGWPAEYATRFYENSVNAIEIADSPPSRSIYKNSVLQE
jgi:hypothetical protein